MIHRFSGTSFVLTNALIFGMVDSVVGRAEQPAFLARILGFLMERREVTKTA